jgi:hypothetical protein
MTLRFVLLACLGCATVFAADSIEAFGYKWTVPIAADWKVSPAGVLELLVPRPSTQPRRPSQYALAETEPMLQFEAELEAKAEPEAVRKRRNSLILVYAWRDPEHFNYVHLSVDAAKQQPVHNGVFHVYGGDRVRISSEEGPGSLRDAVWHKVRLRYDGHDGRVGVWVDGETSPSLQGVDLSLGAGRFGIGSFFDMGTFRNVKIQQMKTEKTR